MSIFDKIGSTILQTGTSLINNAISQYNAKEQRDWQEKMMDKANAYNTPLAQALRMRSAGLNPYQDMGAVPSASAGTGATAQTIPLQDPLSSALTLSQIHNLDAQTGKTDNEKALILKELSLAEFAYSRGYISEDEYKKLIKDSWKKILDLGETPDSIGVQQGSENIKNTTADTDLKGAQQTNQTAQASNQTAQANESQARADKAEAERLFTEALTATENALRDARVQTEKARATAENASAAANLANANLLIQQGKLVENQADRDAFRRSAETFFGFNFDGIDPELVASFLSYYSDVYSGTMNPTTALTRAKDDLQRYIDNDLYVPKSESKGRSVSVAWGLLSGSRDDSKSGEVPKRSSHGGGSTW